MVNEGRGGEITSKYDKSFKNLMKMRGRMENKKSLIFNEHVMRENSFN